MLKSVLLVWLLLAQLPVTAQTVNRLTLEMAEKKALAFSPKIKASQSDRQAAAAQADSQNSLRWPKLSLLGSYRYQTEVPQTVNGTTVTTFGAHHVYSIGPSLTFPLWDEGIQKHLAQSLELIAAAREQDHQLEIRRLLSAVRLNYLSAQVAYEEWILVKESLDLAQRQYNDVMARFRAGAASRLDQITSEREVSNFRLKLEQSTIAKSLLLQDLLALLGEDIRQSVELESWEDTAVNLKQLLPSTSDHPDLTTNPQLQAQILLKHSAEKAAASQGGALWPTLQLEAKSTLEYPNGPVREEINQNSIGASLAWSLWDWGSIRSKRNQKRFEAQSSEFRSQQIATDLQRDWQKAQEELRLLQESNKWATAVSEQSQNLSRLYYEAYRAGRLNLTDVETANLRWFEAKVQKTRIQAQIYGQWIVLRALIGEEGKS